MFHCACFTNQRSDSLLSYRIVQVVSAEPAQPDVMEMDVGHMSEEQQLEWALRMSMSDNAPAGQ